MQFRFTLLCAFVATNAISFSQISVTSAMSASVQSYGAVGDGQADDTNAIQRAIDSVMPGTSLDFGAANKTYLISRRLILKPNRNYVGAATIRMNRYAAGNPQVAALKYAYSDAVTIDGLTFDANGVGGGLVIAVDGEGAIPARNVSITNTTFRNTRNDPQGEWDGAIYNPVGWQSGAIRNNSFVNCGRGISITNANQVVIADNSFNNVTRGDAIFLLFKFAPFDFGKGLQVTGNRGQNLRSMAIEMWGYGVQGVDSVLIADNSFTDWYPDAVGAFGISIMTGIRAQVIHNNLVAGAAGLGYGIELGAPNSVVERNTVAGFKEGIAMHESIGSTVANNLLMSQEQAGIKVTNAPGAKRALTLRGNNIWNAREFGIWFDTADWGGSTVSGNNILRGGGSYPEDYGLLFTGIATTPPNSPVTVSGNSVVQYSRNPPPGFALMGVRLNGGAGENSQSTYDGNKVTSPAANADTVGVFINGAGGADGTNIRNSTFETLRYATGGAPSSGAILNNNRLVNCLYSGPLQVQ